MALEPHDERCFRRVSEYMNGVIAWLKQCVRERTVIVDASCKLEALQTRRSMRWVHVPGMLWHWYDNERYGILANAL